MISSTFGAPLGGTTEGGQYGLESLAVSLITPPNFGGSGGSCLPSSVMVALGEPGVPVICWAAADPARRPGNVTSKVARPVANSNVCFGRHLFCSSIMGFLLSFDAAEPNVTGRSVDRFGMARRRPVATAVIGRAQMRPTLEHLARDLDVGRTRVVALVFATAARVFRDTAGLRRIGLMLGRVPIGRPFPDIADHVVEAIAVRRKRRHRRCPLIAVGRQILVRKLALPGVGHLAPAGREVFAPGELGTVETAACREFPLGLGGQLLARPLGISLGVFESDMHYRVLVQSADRAAGSVRPAPVGAKLERP